MDELLMAFLHSVCGIPLVASDSPKVVLVLHPQDDAGDPYYDCFGGPMTYDPLAPLSREMSAAEYVAEETGVFSRPQEWTEIVTLRGDDWEIAFYYLCHPDFAGARTHTHHAVSIEPAFDLPLNILPALRWLIPLALDSGVVKPLGLAGIQL